MPDNTLKRLVELIEQPEDPELRRAAIQVAGALEAHKERNLIRAILEVLETTDGDARSAAIDSLGQLQAEEALPQLVDIVRQGGVEADRAARAASQLGSKGAKAMAKVMHEAAPGLRSRIAAMLAKSGGHGALVVTAHALLDEDPRVAEAAARSLAMEIPGYSSAQRQALARFLLDTLKDKKARHAPATEAALTRVLGNLREPKAEDVFWAKIVAPSSPEVRAAALQALGNLGVKPSDKRVPALLACAQDRDFQIVAASLMLLKQLPASGKHQKYWLKLLDAPDVAARRFAVERLRGVENKEAAGALAAQLSHPDRGLRDEALAALRSFSAGRSALLAKLNEAASVDDAWLLARAVAPAAGELTKTQRNDLLKQALTLHDREDRRANAIFFLLREADHDWTRAQLLERAQGLRQKKKFAEALSYYRMLVQDPACSEETRFELAATGLKLSNRDLTVEARNNEPALHQFTRLLQNPEFDLSQRIAKAKWLDGDELFYLGFHFSEQTQRAREFGKEVLELVVKRTGKTELGKQAKRKLKSEGLE